jgi:exodeoxyribonuclease VII large subunit
MTSPTRIDLRVPYSEKDDAKALGAWFDRDTRTWYAPPGTNLENLKRWLPEGVLVEDKQPVPSQNGQPQKGIALTELLARVKGVVDQGLPDAIWVRAEISELRGKNGHLYLTLTERNERGDILAQIKGIIWRSRAEPITAKFEQVTGEGLRTDIKILCLAKVRFDVLYGLDLIIEDVDPSFTLGDLAAKMARIREKLLAAGVFDRNKRLPAPVDFVRVAVISPETSAGLGDFQRESNRLQTAILCEFKFFRATFQGLDAPSSIRTAVQNALAAHRQSPFDALVVIRGGGSVTDLAWLNDLQLATVLCLSPIPVLTGIGHERDITILDDIAHTRFDTPSKVALHIVTTIKDNAVVAIQAWERINALVGRIILREKTMVETQAERIETGIRTLLRRVESDQQAFVTLILTTSSAQVRQASQTLENERRRVLDQADKTLCDAELGIAHLTDAISQRAQLQVSSELSAIDRLAHTVVVRTQGGLEAAVRDLAHLHDQFVNYTNRMVTEAGDDLGTARDAISTGTSVVIEDARKDIESFARMVVGLGPQSTLQRGFAIARDDENNPLTSREAAMQHASFRVEFRDGAVAVDNRDFEGRGKNP